MATIAWLRAGNELKGFLRNLQQVHNCPGAAKRLSRVGRWGGGTWAHKNVLFAKNRFHNKDTKGQMSTNVFKYFKLRRSSNYQTPHL